MTEVGRVTFLITASGVGGAEQQVHDMALMMQSRGWQTSAVSMLPLGHVFADLPDAGISTASLGMRKSVPDPRAIWRMRGFLQEHEPQILHAHMVHANLLARLVRLIHPKPIVISTMHNQNQGGRWRSVAYRVTDRLSACTTTVSQVALEDALEDHIAPPSRLLLVPNGIEASLFGEDSDAREQTRRSLGIDDEFLWLAAGRLVDAKDYPNMLAAMTRLLAATDMPTRLVVAGDGELEDQLREQVVQAGLSDRVEMLGLRGDVPALMQAADGFVMSSAWEGLPMVLLEAGASGLPAVVTDVGGSRDSVLDGRSGYIVPPADPQALADAMRRVMEMPIDGRHSMGEAARVHISQTFDMDAVCNRWEAIYQDLLEAAGRTTASS